MVEGGDEILPTEFELRCVFPPWVDGLKPLDTQRCADVTTCFIT
jgi:hypothetical protein